MKRTGFKRKIGKPLARTSLKRGSVALRRGRMRKVGKTPIGKLKRKLWSVFSEYIRKRDKGICFTCGRKCEGSGYHAGHFISKAVGGIVLYFHPENVKGQCYNCNINLGGNQWEYGQRLGEEKVKELYSLKNGPPQKWDEARYLYEIEWYKQLLSELED